MFVCACMFVCVCVFNDRHVLALLHVLVVEVVQTMHSVGVHVYVNVCGIVCMQMCVCVLQVFL